MRAARNGNWVSKAVVAVIVVAVIVLDVVVIRHAATTETAIARGEVVEVAGRGKHRKVTVRFADTEGEAHTTVVRDRHREVGEGMDVEYEVANPDGMSGARGNHISFAISWVAGSAMVLAAGAGYANAGRSRRMRVARIA